jgi:hypothetical protein
MKKSFNNENSGLKERGPVWKVKIGIRSGVSEKAIEHYKKSKKLKLKVILN